MHTSFGMQLSLAITPVFSSKTSVWNSMHQVAREREREREASFLEDDDYLGFIFPKGKPISSKVTERRVFEIPHLLLPPKFRRVFL